MTQPAAPELTAPAGAPAPQAASDGVTGLSGEARLANLFDGALDGLLDDGGGSPPAPGATQAAPPQTETPPQGAQAGQVEQLPDGQPQGAEAQAVDDPYVMEWAQIVDSAPQRLAEVSPDRRGEVIEGVKAIAANQAVEMAIQTLMPQVQERIEEAARIGYARGRLSVQTETSVAELERMRDEDPEAFAKYTKEHPEALRALAGQEQATARSGAREHYGPLASTAIATATSGMSGEQVAEVQQIIQRWAAEARQQGQERYSFSDQGLSVLQMDLGRAAEIVRSRTNGHATPPAQARPASPPPPVTGAVPRGAGAVSMADPPSSGPSTYLTAQSRGQAAADELISKGLDGIL